MKKIFCILLVVVMAAGLLTGCGNANKVIGKWEMSAFQEISPEDAAQLGFGKSRYFEFKDDGEVDYYQDDELFSTVPYEIDGDQISFTQDGQSVTLTLDGDQMTANGEAVLTRID